MPNFQRSPMTIRGMNRSPTYTARGTLLCTLGLDETIFECVPPFTRGVLGHEIGLVLARELRPLVPGHPLPLSSPQRIQWHVCGGRRGQDGCDRAETVCVSCHGDIPGRLCRLLDRKWHNGYPVRSAPAQLSPGVGDAGHALLAQGILPRRCA